MQTQNSADALNLKNLTKSYGDLVAVNDLSLDIFQGEIFGFLGPNGAGKTTAINMICGLLKCDSGDVYVYGKHLRDHYQKNKTRMGLCPQNLVIWESLTCLEQLEFMGQQYNVNRKKARGSALELLEILGLQSKQDKLAKTLSGGMKRRLNLALALVHDPELLILDEPQAGLDPQSRLLVREYIRSLTRKKTVILTTHEMDEADRLSDRVAIIDHGKLLVLDTPDNLKNRIGKGDMLEVKMSAGQDDQISLMLQNLPQSLEKLVYQNGFLRLVNVDIYNILPILLKIVKQNRLSIEDMTIRKKTLEDVFISITGRGLRE
jgi:ABC-2 type transport system ATP-binding protein